MKVISFIIIAFALISSALYGQSVTKCDMTNFPNFSKKVGHMGHQEILDFLLTFDEECRSNTEYSEWSNEILFELLEKQTELTVKTITHQQKRIEIAAILKHFGEPLHDRFDLTKLINKVEKVKFDSEIKNEIINELKVGAAKKK